MVHSTHDSSEFVFIYARLVVTSYANSTHCRRGNEMNEGVNSQSINTPINQLFLKTGEEIK